MDGCLVRGWMERRSWLPAQSRERWKSRNARNARGYARRQTPSWLQLAKIRSRISKRVSHRPSHSIFALPHLNSAGEGHPCEQVQQHSAGRNIGAVPEERAKAHSLSTRWFLNKVEQRKSIGTRTRKPRRRGQTSRPRLHTRLGPFQREGFELGFCSVRLRVHDASTQGRMIGGS